jgi:predicted MFS family arabinose efflux permease
MPDAPNSFMDVVQPKWAATQFTAYMSLLNVTIWYSATWQGWAIEKYGYPATLTADAVFGVCCIALLPLISPSRRTPSLNNFLRDLPRFWIDTETGSPSH